MMDSFEKSFMLSIDDDDAHGCPYRNGRCPLDIMPDEEACCDNDYESCWVYLIYKADEDYGT